MACRSFRWWPSDLQAARSGGGTAPEASGDQEEEAPPGTRASGPRTADAIVDAVDDGEGQGKRTPRAAWIKQQQAKVRTPKKRSIVELFAVAPPVENQAAVDDAADDEGGGQQQEEQVTTTGDDQGIAAHHGDNNNISHLGGDDDSHVPGPAAAPPAVAPRKRKLEFVEILMRKKRPTRMAKTTTAKHSTSSSTTPTSTSNDRGSRKKRMHKNNNKSKVGALHKDGNKDIMHNVSLPCKVDFSLLLHGSGFRRHGKKIKKHVGKRKKEIIKCLPKKKKKKSVQTTSTATKKQHRKCASFPVQGILKKHNGVTSSEKNKKNCHAKKFGSACHVGRKSRKRVHFSDGNDMVSFRNEHENNELPVEFPEAVSINKASSDTIPASSCLDESNKDNNSDIDEVDKVTVPDTADISQVSSPNRDGLVDIHVSSVVSVPIDLNLRSSETAKLAQSLDLNNTLHDCHNSDLPTPSLGTAPGDLPSGESDTSLEENLLWRTISTSNRSGALLSHILDRNMTTGSFPVSISQSSVSGSGRQDNCYQSCPTNDTVNNTSNPTSESQAFGAPHLKDLKDNKQLPENMSRITPASSCQGKYNTRDVIGLPLNSQGELIRWNSCSHVISNQLLQNHSEVSCSDGSFRLWDTIEPRYSECMKMKDKLLGYAGVPTRSACQLPYKTFIERNQYNVTTDPSFTEFSVGCYKDHCQGLMQGHDSYKQHLEMNHPATNISSRGKRELHPLHSCNGMRLIQTGNRSQAGFVIQPTMRLMGKDVTVTVNSADHHGLHSCKARRDNLYLNENHPVPSLSNPSISNWSSQDKTVDFQSSEASRQLYLSGMQNKNSYLHQRILGDPRMSLADANCEPCEICNNAISMCGGCFEGSSLDFAIRNSTQVVNTSSKRMGSPFTMMSQKPFAEANFCKSFQSMPQNHINHLLSFGGTACPPLHNQYYENKFHPMSTHSPVQSLPHWLRNVTQNKDVHSPYFDVVSKHQPCTVSDSACCPVVNPVCHSIISFPVNHSSSNDRIIHSLPIPSSQGAPFMAPTCVEKSNNDELKEKQKNSGALMPGYHCLVSTAHNHKVRKGCYQQSDEFQRPAKKPSFTVEHRSGYHEGTCIDLNGSEAVSLHSRRESRAGPIRLAAGAKHILRPCLNNDQDCSTPVHSTIPFSVGTSYRNILDPQAKSAKIYQF